MLLNTKVCGCNLYLGSFICYGITFNCFLLSRFVIERESARKENNEQAKEERVMVGNLSLPGRVFPSREEEEVGLLNRAAPRY